MIKFAFYTYLPARLLRKATFEEQMIHNFILDFKDGKNYAKKKAARLVGNSISFKDCSNVVFCCIPASSAYATARRYKKFSAMVCELCGAENAFDHRMCTARKPRNTIPMNTSFLTSLTITCISTRTISRERKLLFSMIW